MTGLASGFDDETRRVSGRDLETAKREAEEALSSYAEVLHVWNAPDNEHSIAQLRGLVEDTIRDEFGGPDQLLRCGCVGRCWADRFVIVQVRREHDPKGCRHVPGQEIDRAPGDRAAS